MRAPNKSVKNMNMGAKWLRNGDDNNRSWGEGVSAVSEGTTVHGSGKTSARFMEVDGVVSKVQGATGGITVIPRNQKTVCMKIG